MHADTLEQGDILVRSLAIFFGLSGIGGNRRQYGFQVFEKRIYLFHLVGALLIVRKWPRRQSYRLCA